MTARSLTGFNSTESLTIGSISFYSTFGEVPNRVILKVVYVIMDVKMLYNEVLGRNFLMPWGLSSRPFTK